MFSVLSVQVRDEESVMHLPLEDYSAHQELKKIPFSNYADGVEKYLLFR